jgi:Flp pilus assembly protein TadG
MTGSLPRTTPRQFSETRPHEVHSCLHRVLAAARSGFADQRGQALPEFALLLPIIAVVLFGIIEFGLALNSESDETHLANEVARYAIVNENPGGSDALQEWAKKQGDNNFLKSGAKICISFPEGSEVGRPVKVEATSTIKWVPALDLKVSTTTIRGTAYMRMESVPSAYKAGCSS